MDVDELALSLYTGWAINWYTKNELQLTVNLLSMAMSRCVNVKSVCRLKLDAHDFIVQVVRVGEFTLGTTSVYPQHIGHFILIARCRSYR